MDRSTEINELGAALAKAQATIKNAPKENTARAGAYSYNYATLAGTWEACRKALTDNGLSVVQPVETDGQFVRVTTILLHASGQFISETLAMTAKDAAPQSIGSAITYGRRYGFGAMVGVATEEDDDAAGAQPGKNGHDKKDDAKEAEARAARMADEFRAALMEAKNQEAFDATCAKIKDAADKGWISAKQREILKPLAAQIQGGLVKPAQASK